MKILTPFISVSLLTVTFLCGALLAEAQNAQMTEGPTYDPVPGPTSSCECKYTAKTCPSGQFMRGINEDGSLVCAKPSGGFNLSLGNGSNTSTGSTSSSNNKPTCIGAKRPNNTGSAYCPAFYKLTCTSYDETGGGKCTSGLCCK